MNVAGAIENGGSMALAASILAVTSINRARILPHTMHNTRSPSHCRVFARLIHTCCSVFRMLAHKARHAALRVARAARGIVSSGARVASERWRAGRSYAAAAWQRYRAKPRIINARTRQ